MKLWALSDLHVNHGVNHAAIRKISPHPEDWLILAGDIAERTADLSETLALLRDRFAQLVWVPGNHELWTLKGEPRGHAKYQALVEACRALDTLTPEDPWPAWPEDPDLLVCPLFCLYDYTFAPDGVSPEDAVSWAREKNIVCTDEIHLHPDPFPSRASWCANRLRQTRLRLDHLASTTRTILINHWPLRRDLVRLFSIPRFVPWCGTRATEDWHTRYRAEVVVSGHLHMRATDWRDGVRFEEVSLGYPRHWTQARGAEHYLRQIWPHEGPRYRNHGPHWHR